MPIMDHMTDGKTIRIVLGSLALILLAAFELWALLQIRFAGLDVAMVGFLIQSVPVAIYFFSLESRLGSVVVGLVLIATRVWFITFLLTSDSSTAGIIMFPVLLIDLVAIGIAAIAESARRSPGVTKGFGVHPIETITRVTDAKPWLRYTLLPAVLLVTILLTFSLINVVVFVFEPW